MEHNMSSSNVIEARGSAVTTNIRQSKLMRHFQLALSYTPSILVIAQNMWYVAKCLARTSNEKRCEN